MVGELHEFEMNLNDIISSGGYCMRLCLKKTKTKTRNKTNKQTNRIDTLDKAVGKEVAQ